MLVSRFPFPEIISLSIFTNSLKYEFLFDLSEIADVREDRDIYTTAPIDPKEPKFEKILIANRGLL